jgi:hypothetical protein
VAGDVDLEDLALPVLEDLLLAFGQELDLCERESDLLWRP